MNIYFSLKKIKWMCLLVLLICCKVSLGQKDTLVYTLKKVTQTNFLNNDDSSRSYKNSYLLPVFAENDKVGVWMNVNVQKNWNLDTLHSMEVAIKNSQDSALDKYLNFDKMADSTTNLKFYDAYTTSVIFNRCGYVNLQNDYSSFQGGKYPIETKTYTCYDIVSQKQLKIHDILNLDAANLQRLLERNYREQYNDQELKTLKDGKIEPNGNFYFNKKGIHFYYNVEELSAKVEGAKCIFISYEQLYLYLNSTFKERMHL